MSTFSDSDSEQVRALRDKIAELERMLDAAKLRVGVAEVAASSKDAELAEAQQDLTMQREHAQKNGDYLDELLRKIKHLSTSLIKAEEALAAKDAELAELKRVIPCDSYFAEGRAVYPPTSPPATPRRRRRRSMPTDNPTWWTVLDAIPAWRPTIRVSTVDNAYEFPLAQHHDNADSLAKLAVIEGLRNWLNRPGERSVGDMSLSAGAASALLWGDDADLIAAALAIATATNPIASPPANEGHNPAALVQKPSGSGTYGQRGAES